MSGMTVARGRPAEVRRILTLVLWLNLGVLLVKLGVWAISGATSVLAESMHSGLDAANNIFALTMARVAARAPDADHPYGHGKFETIGALALVGVLSITVFELVQHSLLRMAAGTTPPVVGFPALGLMAFSLVAGMVVARYEMAAGRRLESPLLLADAAHTRADVLATGAVLLGLAATYVGVTLADPLATILVAVLIAHTGWEIIRESVPVLVDERAVHPMKIQTLATSVDGVESAYSIRSRGRPGHLFAELTIAVDRTLDVETSHGIADRVESSVAEALEAEVIVHVEPADPPSGQ